MKLWKCCLLVLLSVALPVQAVLAAVQGGCLVHTQRAGTGQAPGDARAADPAQIHGPHGQHGPARADTDCPHHRAGASSPATAVAEGGTAEPDAHHAAGDPSTSLDTDCSHCSGCCPGSAPPSTSARWQGPQEQRSALQQATPAHPSLPRGALERPPRAPAPVVFKA